MFTRIKNNTLPHGFGFEMEMAPAFPGKKNIVTDTDMLMGDIIETDFQRTDLFLVSKNRYWIKRFVGEPGKKDLFVQITPEAAINWLVENGYLQDPDMFDLDELLTVAMRYEPTGPRTISIKPIGSGPVAKRNEFPNRFI
jgi:hypothetical protein